ncbi:hypothetical protein [Edaphobacillus lindanitolerans]|uniref:Uncharacterized protein n=1 Tax=Edaphobacillus lindanitolerans TaxID=550447 RepID=A0A1U7PKD7_9BACI|nr:hypothetical protein [Edaphobacillus lindanitolerans]SIT71604.1 hypothetical protein SAMN05428946_0751 [Edaphobacillus lindanitolerans]
MLFSATLTFTLFIGNASMSSASTLDEGINSGLAEGEMVVDTFTELIPDNEVIGEEIFLEEDSDEVLKEDLGGGNLITPFERRKGWYGVSSTYQGLTYGSWLFAGASTISGGRLTASHTKTVANRYSGTLKIPIKSLESVVGFDTTKSWSQTVGYVSDSYPNGRYRLEYRHVYKKYKVKQEQKYDRRAPVVYDTKYVYPQKWVERQYRVVKF